MCSWRPVQPGRWGASTDADGLMILPRVGEPFPCELAEARVFAGGGVACTLGELMDLPTLLLFVRRFGCIGCDQMVGEVAPRLHELRALGLCVVIVGNGEARFIDEFDRRHGLAEKGAVIVTDPSLHAFDAAGLKRTFWSVWGPRALYGMIRAKGRGYSASASRGDRYQQGGALLVGRDRRVRVVHRNDSLADRPDPNDLVDEAMRLLLEERGEQLEGLV